MDALQPSRYLLADLELTRWPSFLQRGWSGPDKYCEVLQSGFVDLEPSSDFMRNVREHSAKYLCWPRCNPILSAYFISLTGISNEHLSQACLSI
jgi:hypothetical protein